MDLAGPNFTAIDFETANPRSDSACSIGLVRVEGGEIVRAEAFLIRPPTDEFHFTDIHGIRWEDVRGEPTFEELWPRLDAFLEGVDFYAAHNASFDRRILSGCCERYGLVPPAKPFLCTVTLARRTWNLFPTKLPNVASYLGLELKHHDALSDAQACAEIVRRAHRDRPEMFLR